MLVLAAAMVAGVGELALREVNDPRFALARVDVGDVHRITREQVLGAAALPAGPNVWLTDMRAPAARVERIPWVGEAHITRGWPNRVRIDVLERVPVARVRLRGRGPARYDLIDRSLRVLAVEARASEDAHLPILDIAPLPAGADGAGAKVSNGDVARALDAFEALMRLGLRAVEIQSRPARGLVAVEQRGIAVLFGNTDDLDQKVALFRAISARISDPRRVVYVDVRSTRTPTVLYR